MPSAAAAAAAKSLQLCPTLCDPRDGSPPGSAIPGLQPPRLLRPWGFPGRSTGVGRHCLLQCMKVKSESEVAQSHPTCSDPMDCSLPGSSIHGVFQARVLEWGANKHMKRCSTSRNITHQRNAKQNHNEIPFHASQNDCDPKVYKQ